MTTRIEEKFKYLNKKNKKALVCFLTAGDPNKKISAKVLSLLPESGADLIEIGIPFSDPMADGPTIQRSSLRAIKSGINLKQILEMVRDFRKNDSRTPIILMGYYNPIFQYGLKNFFIDSSKSGVDGIIAVDLPPEENSLIYDYSKKFNIDIIRLLTPTTDIERLKKILKSTSGFLYYVSIMGITGTKKPSITLVKKSVNKIKQLTSLPVVVGFGINNSKQVKEINKFSDGCVIGSALVKILEGYQMGKFNYREMKTRVNIFLSKLNKAC